MDKPVPHLMAQNWSADEWWGTGRTHNVSSSNRREGYPCYMIVAQPWSRSNKAEGTNTAPRARFHVTLR